MSAGAGAAVMAAGGIIGAYGAIQSASDQSDIDNQKAALERSQAAEVLQRQQINDAQSQNAAQRAKFQFGSSFAASGHEGSGLGSQLEIQRQTDVQQSLNDREAQFQSGMLTAGANMQSQLSTDTTSAGYINAASSILGGAGKAAAQPSLWSPGTGTGGPQSLPPPPEGY